MLRGASLDIVIADQRATITGAARVGTGRIRVEGQGRFQGVMPTLISATATLRGVPFTLDELEPRVDAKVALSLWRSVGLWRSRVTVSDVDVVLIERNNPEILPVTFPDDLVFVDEIPARGTAPERRRSDAPAPGRDRDSAPAMIAKVRIVPAMVRSRDLRTRIGGELEVRLGGGDPVVHGKLEADEGFVELFGRRYLIMSATVRFDGGPDPYIAVRLAYDFPEATLYIDLTGRASAPKIVLSSEPAIYSQSQLAAFLLGSTPEDAPGDATRDAAASVAAAVVSDTVRNAIDDVLPIPIDVLRVETKTTERSGSVTVGKWITRRVLVALRTRVDAHADENANEAELEYWIRRNVLLEAYAGDRSIFGADLLWIRRY